MRAKEEYTVRRTGLFNDETLFLYTYTAQNGMVFNTEGKDLDTCRKFRDRWLCHLSASFTGHRGVTDVHKTAERLRAAIMECYNSGVRFFYVGGAVGFDTIAAEAVLHFREQFPDIVLTVVVPFPEQDKFFNFEGRKKYREILDKANEVVTISNEFSKVAYLMRNDYMVSHSCRVIAYWDGMSGSGTSYTVREAKKRKRSVQNLF